MKNLFAMVAVMSLMSVSCTSMKQKILDTSAVSMNHHSLPKGTKFTDLGPVKGSFCMDGFNQKGEFGLMDEAVKDAHAKTGAEVITAATFYSEGSCVTVEGDGKKVATK